MNNHNYINLDISLDGILVFKGNFYIRDSFSLLDEVTVDKNNEHQSVSDLPTEDSCYIYNLAVTIIKMINNETCSDNLETKIKDSYEKYYSSDLLALVQKMASSNSKDRPELDELKKSLYRIKKEEEIKRCLHIGDKIVEKIDFVLFYDFILYSNKEVGRNNEGYDYDKRFDTFRRVVAHYWK